MVWKKIVKECSSRDTIKRCQLLGEWLSHVQLLFYHHLKHFFDIFYLLTEPVWCNGRVYDWGEKIPASKLPWANGMLPQARKLICTDQWPSQLGMLIGLSPHHCCTRPSSLNCENEYLVLSPGEETTVQAVVGSIARAFLRLKKSRSREMSAHVYVLHSVCP